MLLWHLLMFVPLAVLIFGDPRFRAPYDLFGLSLAAVVIASYLPRSAEASSYPVREERQLDTRTDRRMPRSVG